MSWNLRRYGTADWAAANIQNSHNEQGLQAKKNPLKPFSHIPSILRVKVLLL